jgi:hypothetical protein
LLLFSHFAETQPESLKQNQNWERSDQPYTQVQKLKEKKELRKERGQAHLPHPEVMYESNQLLIEPFRD